jgi:hypothetical protein
LARLRVFDGLWRNPGTPLPDFAALNPDYANTAFWTRGRRAGYQRTRTDVLE